MFSYHYRVVFKYPMFSNQDAAFKYMYATFLLLSPATYFYCHRLNTLVSLEAIDKEFAYYVFTHTLPETSTVSFTVSVRRDVPFKITYFDFHICSG